MTKNIQPFDGDLTMIAATEMLRLLRGLPDANAITALNVATAHIIAKQTPFDLAVARARQAGKTISHLTSRFAERRMGQEWAGGARDITDRKQAASLAARKATEGAA